MKNNEGMAASAHLEVLRNAGIGRRRKHARTLDSRIAASLHVTDDRRMPVIAAIRVRIDVRILPIVIMMAVVGEVRLVALRVPRRRIRWPSLDPWIVCTHGADDAHLARVGSSRSFAISVCVSHRALARRVLVIPRVTARIGERDTAAGAAGKIGGWLPRMRGRAPPPIARTVIGGIVSVFVRSGRYANGR